MLVRVLLLHISRCHIAAAGAAASVASLLSSAFSGSAAASLASSVVWAWVGASVAAAVVWESPLLHPARQNLPCCAHHYRQQLLSTFFHKLPPFAKCFVVFAVIKSYHAFLLTHVHNVIISYDYLSYFSSSLLPFPVQPPQIFIVLHNCPPRDTHCTADGRAAHPPL